MNAIFPAPADPTAPQADPGAVTIESLCLYAAVMLTVAGMVLAPFRYLAYGTPYLCLVAVLARRRVLLPREAWPFLALAVVGLLMAPMATGRGLKDLYFMVAGVSVGFAFADRRVPLAGLLALFIGGHAAAVVLSGRGGALSMDIGGSYSAFESSFAFLFGLVAVAALTQGRRTLAALAAVMTFLAFKRIAVLAVLACAAVWFLPPRLRRVVLSTPVAVLASAAYLAIVVAFTHGAFDEFLKETVGQSANAFTMGRQFRYGATVEALTADPLRYLFIGDGPGAAYEYLAAGTGLAGKANLHNDLLKILIEYGAIVLSGFLVLLYVARTPAQRLLALYTHVLLLTDNVLIYHFYLLFFVLIGAAVAPPRAAREETS